MLHVVKDPQQLTTNHEQQTNPHRIGIMRTKMNIFILFILNVVLAGTLYASGNSHEHQAAGHFKPASLIEPLGALTFLCLISTFILGQLMPKNRKTLFSWHKRMAFITLIVALTHVSMVLLFH